MPNVDCRWARSPRSRNGKGYSERHFEEGGAIHPARKALARPSLRLKRVHDPYEKGFVMFEVVISGAGPNGLMLACELALAGVRPLVLEKLTSPTTEPRANGMVGPVIRVLDRRGLLERLTGDKKPPQPAPEFMFAAFPLPLRELPDNPVYTVLVPQRRIEEMLAGRATELGVEIRRGHEITGLSQDDDRVVVDATGPDGGYQLEAQFLVGADGGRSVTRKLAGIDFPGVTNDRTVSRIFDVTIPSEMVDRESGGLDIPGYGVVPPFLHHRTERGLVAYAPFPDGRRMLVASTRDRPETGAEYTFVEFREVLDYVIGVEVPVGPPADPKMNRRISGGNTRLADRYRSGRVLLVGDAAHVHSAIGGSGLNLGLQDAINLGWKLAATVRQWAPPGLLDTYESERRPAAQRVTMQTQAQSALIGPGPDVTALRTLFGELLEEPAVVRRIAGVISGADIRYDMGSDSPETGRFAPDLGPAMRTGRPLLTDPTGRLADVAAPWKDRVDVIRDGHSTSLLVRPDSYVAWASSDQRPNTRELKAALRRWFGEPA
jgi:2-polyprenyl-6-methoxyphenol hydroxylase-like FAD-dependent oxidoreductase